MTTVAVYLAQVWLAVGIHLWQTTLVLLVVFLLARWMRSAPARLVHFLWSAALAKVLLPIALFGSLGRSIAQLLPDSLLATAAHPSHVTLETIRVVLDPSSVLISGGAAPRSPIAWLVIALTLLWGLGACRGLLRLAREYPGATADRGLPAGALTPSLRHLLGAATEGISIPSECVRVTDEMTPPYVAGLLRPRIFVSGYLLETLSTAEMRAILLHEESHRRRRDPLQNTLLRLFGCLLFFYPLLGMLLRRLRQTTELVCDERVVRAGVDRETYARALARTVRFGLARAPHPLAAGVGGGDFLRHRFERLTHHWRYSGMRRHRIVLVLVVLLVAIGTLLPQSLVAEKSEAPLDLDKQPTIIDSTFVRPHYPGPESKAGVEGTVVLRVKVTAEGQVDSIQVAEAIEEHPAFSKAAIEAVRVWRFEPGELDGRAMACWVQIPIRFALE